MHILFITPQFPYPPRQGTTLRNYNLLRYLAERHTVDLLTFHPASTLPPSELSLADSPLHRLCQRVDAVPEPQRTTRQRILDTLRSPLPDMALRLESPQMRQRIHEWVLDPSTRTAYDVVQCEGIEVAQYGLMVAEARAAGHPAPAIIFDDHNCEYLLQKRNALNDLRIPDRWPAALYSLVQWQKLRRYEAQICRTAHATAAVSRADRDALLAIVPGASVTVVSNGIDLTEYTDEGEAGDVRTDSVQPGPKLIFVGKMDYRPNIDAVLWFGQQVWPLIREQVPNAHFQIIGMNPHPRLDELREEPGLEITGAVDRVQPYLQQAAVYVIPLRVGGGTRFKALEAMAARKAVVSTRLGVEGIPVQHEQEMLLADDPVAFAADTVRLLHDPILARQLGTQAHRFVAERYQWSQIVPLFEKMYSAHRGEEVKP